MEIMIDEELEKSTSNPPCENSPNPKLGQGCVCRSETLARHQTLLLRNRLNIGVLRTAISKSNFSQTFDISQTDFKQRGHAYLMQNHRQKSSHILQ
ncbi:hypothetical protein JHK85_009579 [Glycine max]|nr:hypothetical protein JHK85_009579 [Glycine max]